ncbi:hypothetical protein [Spirosoma endbachense]|uniref:Uncharacterized protein n=1 Tax=Spirosoma endbachense TaxID=2666025 RepID=A0A6P1VYY6_9BACT|nr:hypothetical protein [Spirosoma endbachense]QHV97995.1 hypothetical protein GJR95_24605 [Spirosoma endbachense]
MKQKPDEPLDLWVRQSLSRLPDSPPPGSSFDADRLWQQMRPELQSTQPRRRTGLIGWAIAACLAGLVLGWFGLHQSTDEQTKGSVAGTNRKGPTSSAASRKAKLVDEVITPKIVFSEKRRLGVRPQTTSHSRETPNQPATPVDPEPIAALPQIPSLPTVEEIPTVVEKQIVSSKPTVATNTPKRRFRIVHENELRAEEETRPKVYHTEHFVRLGTGQREEPAQEERHSTLIMPLTSKPNQ